MEESSTHLPEEITITIKDRRNVVDKACVKLEGGARGLRNTTTALEGITM